MLRFPKNWEQLRGGPVIARIFKKIGTAKLQTPFASCLVSASLDSFAAACLKKSGSVIKIHRRGKLKWRINDCTFKYYPVVDDDTLFDCYRLGKLLINYTLFVPPGFESVLRNALDGMGIEHVTVFSLSQYVTWRLTWDSHDFRQTSDETLIDLVHRYNGWVRRTSCDLRLLIKAPNPAAASR